MHTYTYRFIIYLIICLIKITDLSIPYSNEYVCHITMHPLHALLIVTQTHSLAENNCTHPHSHTQDIETRNEPIKSLPASQYRPGLHKTIQTPHTLHTHSSDIHIHTVKVFRCTVVHAKPSTVSECELRHKSTYLYYARPAEAPCATRRLRSSNPDSTGFHPK